MLLKLNPYLPQGKCKARIQPGVIMEWNSSQSHPWDFQKRLVLTTDAPEGHVHTEAGMIAAA